MVEVYWLNVLAMLDDGTLLPDAELPTQVLSQGHRTPAQPQWLKRSGDGLVYLAVLDEAALEAGDLHLRYMVQIRRNCRLAKLMTSYCEARTLDKADVIFRLNGCDRVYVKHSVA